MNPGAGIAGPARAFALMMKWSWLLLLSAVLLLLTSLLIAVPSLDYFIRALCIGLLQSTLTVFYWKWLPKEPGVLLLMFLSTVLLVGGFYWSNSQAFGTSHAGKSAWILAVQFFPTALATLFAVLTTLQFNLRRKTAPR